MPRDDKLEASPIDDRLETVEEVSDNSLEKNIHYLNLNHKHLVET